MMTSSVTFGDSFLKGKPKKIQKIFISGEIIPHLPRQINRTRKKEEVS